MKKKKAEHGLETTMLAEDAVKRALVEKMPALAKLDEDGLLTFRYYGREHLIQVTAFDITEDKLPISPIIKLRELD